MGEQILYEEQLTSKKTGSLFASLAILFFALLIKRVAARRFGRLAAVFLSLSGLFLFYTLNYRTLNIRLTPEYLKLTFGIFNWALPVNNISTCQRDDDLPPLLKYGGAGIHFMLFRNRYRASFNFLEHDRVVIELKQKAGWVQDVSFSTRNSDELISRIQEAISANELA